MLPREQVEQITLDLSQTPLPELESRNCSSIS